MAIIKREMLNREDSSSSEMTMIIPTTTTFTKWAEQKESVEVAMIAPKECVKFDETVHVRSYERILSEDPISKYAGFALGWDYEDVSMEGSLSGGFNDDSDDDSTTVHTSTSSSASSTSAASAKVDCQKGHHTCGHGYNDRRSTIRATRYTASERVKILSGYGFGMSEIIRLEFTKREQRDNMMKLEQRRRQQQQQQSAVSRRNFSEDESYANFIPSSSTTTKLTQSTRRLSQTFRKRLRKISSKRRAADMNAWTTE